MRKLASKHSATNPLDDRMADAGNGTISATHFVHPSRYSWSFGKCDVLMTEAKRGTAEKEGCKRHMVSQWIVEVDRAIFLAHCFANCMACRLAVVARAKLQARAKGKAGAEVKLL